ALELTRGSLARDIPAQTERLLHSVPLVSARQSFHRECRMLRSGPSRCVLGEWNIPPGVLRVYRIARRAWAFIIPPAGRDATVAAFLLVTPKPCVGGWKARE